MSGFGSKLTLNHLYSIDKKKKKKGGDDYDLGKREEKILNSKSN